MDLFKHLDPLSRFLLLANGDPPADPPAGGGGAGDPPAGDGTSPPADAAGALPTDSGGASPGETPGETPGEPTRADWRDRQIDKQHRKLKESETRLRELEDENRRLRELAEAGGRRDAPPAPSPATQPPAPAQPVPAAPVAAVPEDRTRVKDEVRLEVQIENLQNTIKDNPEYAKAWPTVYGNYQKVGGLDPATISMMLATDDPAYVMMEVGKDPSRFQDLIDLPATKRQAEFIKIAMSKPRPKAPAEKPSDAPPPVGGLHPGGGGPPPPAAADIYNDKIPDDQWYATRLEQKRKSVGRPWSVGGKGGRAA